MDYSASDEKMISQAKRGDLSAFNQLVLAYQDVVFRQAFWLLNETEAAEDATQEAFIQAYHKLHTLRGGSFRAWVLKIVTNYSLDRLRAAARHPSITLEPYDVYGEEMEPAWMKDPGESPAQVEERKETKQDIARAIQRLSPEFRVVVILADLQGLNYQEISAALHVPMGTVKSRLARARRQLRGDLQNSLTGYRAREQDLSRPAVSER